MAARCMVHSKGHRAGPYRATGVNGMLLLDIYDVAGGQWFMLLLVRLLFMLLIVGRQSMLLSTVFYTVAGGTIGLTFLVGLIFMVSRCGCIVLAVVGKFFTGGTVVHAVPGRCSCCC
jgi:hypothetical protein